MIFVGYECNSSSQLRSLFLYFRRNSHHSKSSLPKEIPLTSDIPASILYYYLPLVFVLPYLHYLYSVSVLTNVHDQFEYLIPLYPIRLLHRLTQKVLLFVWLFHLLIPYVCILDKIRNLLIIYI